jgi:hypothetical protein
MEDEHNSSMQHPELGALRWDPISKWWHAAIDVKFIREKTIGISEVPALEQHLNLAVGFLRWIEPNLEAFLKDAARAAFNFDLIWDDELEEQQLESMLSIQGVNVYGGMIHVWLDAGGATTDHLIQTKLNEKHEIIEMAL